MSEPSGVPAPYIEKLRAPWWLWIVVFAISLALGVALSPTNPVLLTVLAVVAAIIGSVLLIASAPSIVVTPTMLSVGRSTIERHYLGEVTGYRGNGARYQRGRGLNGLAFMCFRGWVDPVVRVQIEDPRDATPYWLFSSRRPEALVAALGGTMADPGEHDDAWLN